MYICITHGYLYWRRQHVLLKMYLQLEHLWNWLWWGSSSLMLVQTHSISLFPPSPSISMWLVRYLEYTNAKKDLCLCVRVWPVYRLRHMSWMYGNWECRSSKQQQAGRNINWYSSPQWVQGGRRFFYKFQKSENHGDLTSEAGATRCTCRPRLCAHQDCSQGARLRHNLRHLL